MLRKTPLKRGIKQLKRSGFQKKTKPTLNRQIGGNKAKSKPISKLKKELWKYFSLYIRQRDNFTCFTCGRKGEGSAMHAGHFISKSVGGIALYFHEENVHAQCYNCNINLSGNQYEYAKRLGFDKADELYRIKNQVTEKWSAQDYESKIIYYKNLVI